MMSKSFEALSYRPIAVFHSSHKETYEAPRQGVLAGKATGWFEVEKTYGAQSVEDLVGFERIWLIYDFHENSSWKPKVRPPRFSEKKRSVFSTRSPYRPNKIGMSCVKLEKVEGCKVYVSGHDILEGSPILDIKPYIPYADSFPEAKTGWLKPDSAIEVQFSNNALEKILWLEEQTGLGFKQILTNQLAYDPTNSKAKRVKKNSDSYVFAIRTWRFAFSLDESELQIFDVSGGYSSSELENVDDPHNDKAIHKAFIQKFS